MNSFADVVWGSHAWSYTAFGGFALIALIVLIFEIWMIVDVINNKKVPSDHKVWWVVGMFILHPFVALAYFIVSRLNDGRA